MGQLCSELRDFDNWYRLGLQLNISKDVLDSIDKLHDTKVGKCIEMIQHWISRSYNPSWVTVHEALRNIGESVLAAKIADKYDIQPSSSSEDILAAKIADKYDIQPSSSSEDNLKSEQWTSTSQEETSTTVASKRFVTPAQHSEGGDNLL